MLAVMAPPFIAKLERGIPRKLSIPLAILCGLVAFHGERTFTGPYRWIADLQLRALGFYTPKLCFLLALASLFVPTFGALQLARRLGLMATDQSTLVAPARSRGPRLWVIPLVLFVLGAVLVGVGTNELISVRGETALETIRVEQLAQGQRPRSSFLRLDGQLLNEQALESGGRDVALFIPVVFQGWTPEQAFPAVVRIRQSDVERFDDEGPYGMEALFGLPAPVLQLWRERGLDASKALLLEFGTTPSARRSKGEWEVGIGLGVVLLALVAAGLILRRRRAAPALEATAPSS